MSRLLRGSGAMSAFLPPRSSPPGWLAWVQLSLSTLLLVLFAVVLNRSLAQVQLLRQLQGRITALESQRSAERAATQDNQLHSFATRLADLEKRQQQREAEAAAERAALSQALTALRQAPRPVPLQDEAVGEEPPPLPRNGSGGAMPLQPLRPGAPAAAGSSSGAR